jgi:capsular polysaccharide biosynthesis protein
MDDHEITPLSSAEIAFHGFVDTAAAEARIRKVGIREGKPRLTVIEDAVFVPARKRHKRREPGTFAFTGGVFGADGEVRQEVHIYRREGEPAGGLDPGPAPSPVHWVDTDVLYLGWLDNRYGHFLLESLSRTWALDDFEPDMPVAFHVFRDSAPVGIFAEILAAVGVSRERILNIDQPTWIRRLVVPEAAYVLGSAAFADAVRPHQEAAARVLGRPPAPSEQPLYLSRSKLPDTQRLLVGEELLEKALRERKFRIVHPETMSFAEQVRAINDHADIVTNDGSAAHNLLFSLSRPRVHYLTDHAAVPDYALVPRLVGASVSYLACMGPGPVEEIGRKTSVHLNVDAVLAYLDGPAGLGRTTRPGT